MDNVIMQEFAGLGYSCVRQLLRGAYREQFFSYALRRAASGSLVPDDQVPGTPALGGDPGMDLLLVRLLPTVEQLTSLKLFWTYSYFRVYKRGDVLDKHTDRPSCEISLTLNLGYVDSKPWPLWIQGRRGTSSIELEAGDAVLYRGIECPHWREPFEGEACAQVFLHYVDQNGPYAEWRYDKRTDVNTTALAGIREGFLKHDEKQTA